MYSTFYTAQNVPQLHCIIYWYNQHFHIYMYDLKLHNINGKTTTNDNNTRKIKCISFFNNCLNITLQIFL